MWYRSTREKASLQVSLALENECEMVLQASSMNGEMLTLDSLPLTAGGCRLVQGEYAVPIWQPLEHLSTISYPALRPQRLLITGNTNCQEQNMPYSILMLPFRKIREDDGDNLGSLGKHRP